MRTLVITPTYNESETLPATLRRVRQAVPDVDVLIVDDASPDGTGVLADGFAAADPAVHVLHRPGKQGLGVAYRAGFRWGLERGYDVLVEMDADGSHQPEQLPVLLERIADTTRPADVVIGSRWVPGGSVRNWPAHRHLLSRGANLYTQLLLGISVRDATAGFRAYRRTVLEAIDLHTVASQGYCFQIDLVWRAVRKGFTIAEVPIEFVERSAGVSKMSGDIVREALTQVTAWGLLRKSRQVRRVLADPARVRHSLARRGAGHRGQTGGVR